MYGEGAIIEVCVIWLSTDGAKQTWECIWKMTWPGPRLPLVLPMGCLQNPCTSAYMRVCLRLLYKSAWRQMALQVQRPNATSSVRVQESATCSSRRYLVHTNEYTCSCPTVVFRHLIRNRNTLHGPRIHSKTIIYGFLEHWCPSPLISFFFTSLTTTTLVVPSG